MWGILESPKKPDQTIWRHMLAPRQFRLTLKEGLFYEPFISDSAVPSTNENWKCKYIFHFRWLIQVFILYFLSAWLHFTRYIFNEMFKIQTLSRKKRKIFAHYYVSLIATEIVKLTEYVLRVDIFSFNSLLWISVIPCQHRR